LSQIIEKHCSLFFIKSSVRWRPIPLKIEGKNINQTYFLSSTPLLFHPYYYFHKQYSFLYMSTPPTNFKPTLSLGDATMIVAGSMIGSGIFIVSADITRNVGGAGLLILVWAITGFMTLIAALSYGELSGMYPKAGGQYVYLKEAYSPLIAFLFGWSFFSVIQTGTIAAVGVAFSKFAAYLIPAFSEDNKLIQIRTGLNDCDQPSYFSISSTLTIKFIELHRELPDSVYSFKAVPAVAIGILILPLFDTLRVFTMRILRGRSPMSPDRNHIHHLLIDSGLNHMQATGILVSVNLLFIFMVWSLQGIGTLNLLLVILSFATLLSGILFLIARKRRMGR